MDDNVIYERCPNCEELSFQITDEHSWVQLSPAGIPNTRRHCVKKCVKCGYEIDECKAEMEDKLRGADNEQDDGLLEEKNCCEIINKSSSIQLARIYSKLWRKQFREALEKIEELSSNEKNYELLVEHRLLISILRACCLYHTDRRDDIPGLFANSGSNFSEKEKAANFLYEILTLLSSEDLTNDSYLKFKGKWFANYIPPYQVLDPGVLGVWCFLMGDKNSVGFPPTLFLLRKFFDNVTVPLMFDLVRRIMNWHQLSNDEVVFLETLSKSVIPTNENAETDCAESNWFREIKRGMNQLSFDLLWRQERFEEAFKYFETTGVDYIRPRDETTNELGDDDLFEIPIDAFPYYPDPKRWLGEEDVHEACWECYYQEIWAEVLQYLTIVDFYKQQLSGLGDENERETIKNRILELTHRYQENEHLQREILHWRFPDIVSEIYKERNDFENLAKCDRSFLGKYDGVLLDELGTLTLAEQRQVYVYIKLILKLERALRQYIRKTFRANGTDFEGDLRSRFSDLAKRIERNSQIPRTVPAAERNGDLDWLTLGELISLIISDKFWDFFAERLVNRDLMKDIRYDLVPIRNDLSHGLLLTQEQITISMAKAEAVLKLLRS